MADQFLGVNLLSREGNSQTVDCWSLQITPLPKAVHWSLVLEGFIGLLLLDSYFLIL